jgi:hypothetical protein
MRQESIMIIKKLIFSSCSGVNIYRTDTGELILERRDYTADIHEKSSLLVMLPLFQSPVGEILAAIKDNTFCIEEIIPFNELLLFLFIEIRSSFWMNLVCNFLLQDTINVQLQIATLDSLRNPDLVKWLPQREKHLVKKLVKRYTHSGH